MRLICLASLLFGLASCASVELPAAPEPEPEPVPLFEPDNIGPWCGYAARLIANPNSDPSLKKTVEELVRSRGC